MSTKGIHNFIKVNDQILTGGQPTVAQLESVAREGVKVVINLAVNDPRYALEDEAEVVQTLGMTYHHIPVVWDHPLESDFGLFETVMSQLDGRKTLIHCAANYRVTAFYSLYALKRLGWTQPQASEFRAQIWADSSVTVWEDFIQRMETRILSQD